MKLGSRALGDLYSYPLVFPKTHIFFLGGEYRFRAESIDEPAFGLRTTPDFTATGQRAFLHADLRSQGGLRLFVQVWAAAEQGREPVERSFDEGAADITQAFVDVPIGAASQFGHLRVGRQELNLLGNRLVATRDSASFRRAFDAVELDLQLKKTRLLLFGGRPVLNLSGAFDDEGIPGERFFGAYLRTALPVSSVLQPDAASVLDVFLFERERPLAIYQDAHGRERRWTFGARLIELCPAHRMGLGPGAPRGFSQGSGVCRLRCCNPAVHLRYRRDAALHADLGRAQEIGRITGTRSLPSGPNSAYVGLEHEPYITAVDGPR